MSLLYKGLYRRRFGEICKLLSGVKVTELCFGDIIIANYCKIHKIEWNGVDINETFVEFARKRGYNAEMNDINNLNYFSKADTCVLSGSLYHFKDNIENLFNKLLDCAPRIIISEPVINLSTRNGIIGKMARAAANVNGQKQNFRFTKETLLETLSNLSARLNFKFQIIAQVDKDLIVLITR